MLQQLKKLCTHGLAQMRGTGADVALCVKGFSQPDNPVCRGHSQPSLTTEGINLSLDEVASDSFTSPTLGNHSTHTAWYLACLLMQSKVGGHRDNASGHHGIKISA